MINEQRDTAVVTGGAQGIGRAIVDSLVQAGLNVCIWEMDGEALQEEVSVRDSSSEWLGIRCDISKENDVKSAFAQTLDHFGNIRFLVNNAAVSANKPIRDLEVDEFRRVIEINLTGAFICAKICETELKKNKGSIINLCSTRAFQSEANTEAYSASKGGIFSLTHALAVSMGPDVRVNSISPGWIDVSAQRKKSNARQEFLSDADHNQHPAGRVGNGEDIANMVLFLCDPKNSFISGQNFIIDGGMTKKMIYV